MLATKRTQYLTKPPQLHSTEVKDLLKASYQRNGEAEKIGKKYDLTLDHSLSNAEHKVFIDKKGNPDVVYTGSRKVGDWVTNGFLALGLGALTPRFRESKQLMEKVKEKYKGKAVTTLGHSLGGSLAESAGGDKVVTLDKGVGLFGIGKKIRTNQTDIRTGNDPVSFLRNTQSGGKKITIKNTKYLNPFYAHDVKHVEKLNQFV